MRWLLAICAVVITVIAMTGCGGGGVSSPPVVSVVGSFLGDGFMSAYTEPVANLGIVVRDDRSVEGAAFFSAPLENFDVFFSGTVDASSRLNATGRIIGNGGTTEVGAFTITGVFANYPDGSNIAGTFTAEGVGAGSGTWRAFIYTTPPLGAYMGAYAGDAQGQVAIMNFLVDDSVMMLKEQGQPRADYFASDLGSLTLTPPTVPGGPYGLVASNGLYGTGFSFAGDVGQLEASGAWQQIQEATTLTGTWLATKPAARAAANRAIRLGPLRVHRVRK